jgi:hypothetical protein
MPNVTKRSRSACVISSCLNLSKTERRERLRAALNGGWYAACENGHAFWHGLDHESYAQADSDAKGHDNAVHGGEPNVVVLND